MTGRIAAIAATEFRIALRNRWVLVAVLLMMLFSLVLTAAGSAPTGALGADRLSVVVASLTSLAVYLVPLLSLLLAFDAVAGEAERGTLPLMLTYPLSRAELLAGKLVAHLGVLALALLAGYGLAAVVSLWADAGAASGLAALFRLFWSSLLLGAAFLGLGYTLSSLARRPSGAAGLVIGLWVIAVVLFDLGLLAMVVASDGGGAVGAILPAALLSNPADAFRMFNLTASEATAAASGLGGAARSIPPMASLGSLALWPLFGFGLALLAFRKVVP
ncbi:ABC transporter permease [Paracoccus sp. SCSIO 75233]|uniref:ABC transporter permease n=1 Tax=Paracoccus sp. SCSIO 75233 TaxID=3017782 RepID=UPI0022F0C652|nr:ABC transporter permease subunit [Paracoccus sp. SCSIO 75233]WBU55218.1 ABC transporter permease subunit [Paracoccus sp. SCSIO 75233]